MLLRDLFLFEFNIKFFYRTMAYNGAKCRFLLLFVVFGTKKCPTACRQANEPNATDCFSRSRWHKVGQVSPLLYKRRQDGGPLHSQIFSVQRSLNLLNTGKLALSFVRKRVKRGADSSDGRNSRIVIVARGCQKVCIARVVIVAGAQPGRYKASALYKGRLGACKNTGFFVFLSEIGVFKKAVYYLQAPCRALTW